MNDESTIIQFPQLPSEEERIPMPQSFVEETRQSYQRSILSTESIKKRAVRNGNTTLAVEATDMIKAAQRASDCFENIVTYCYKVISDSKYNKLYPEEYARLMKEPDDDFDPEELAW